MRQKRAATPLRSTSAASWVSIAASVPFPRETIWLRLACTHWGGVADQVARASLPPQGTCLGLALLVLLAAGSSLWRASDPVRGSLLPKRGEASNSLCNYSPHQVVAVQALAEVSANALRPNSSDALVSWPQWGGARCAACVPRPTLIHMPSGGHENLPRPGDNLGCAGAETSAWHNGQHRVGQGHLLVRLGCQSQLRCR
eukprot:4624288-Prymnesium_polylepis.1